MFPIISYIALGLVAFALVFGMLVLFDRAITEGNEA